MITLGLILGLAAASSAPTSDVAWPDGFPAEFRRALQQLRHPEEPARVDAVKALREFTDPRFEPFVIQRLVDTLDDPSFRVRAHAAFGLGFFGSRAAAHVDRLRNCLQESRVKVRVGAVFAISQMEHPASLSLLVHALGDASEYVRGTIERALNRCEPDHVWPILDPALRHSLAATRVSAIHVLAHGKAPAALTLVAAATRDPDRSVQMAAVRALGEFGTDGAAALTHFMGDAEPDLRRQALDALSHIQDPSVRGQLLRHLDHADAVTRLHSVSLLAAYNHPESVKALAAHLNEPHVGVRTAIVERLGSFGPDAATAVDALLPLLKDQAADVRRAAAGTLGRLQHPKAIPALRRALADPDTDVKRAVRQALGHLGEMEGDLFTPRP